MYRPKWHTHARTHARTHTRAHKHSHTEAVSSYITIKICINRNWKFDGANESVYMTMLYIEETFVLFVSAQDDVCISAYVTSNVLVMSNN